MSQELELAGILSSGGEFLSSEILYVAPSQTSKSSVDISCGEKRCVQSFQRQPLELTATQKNESQRTHLILCLLPSVPASAPDFSRAPMKKLVRVQAGSELGLQCKPHASPRARSSWRKGHAVLLGDGRYCWSRDAATHFPHDTC